MGVDLVPCEVCGSAVGPDDMFVEVTGLVVLVALAGSLALPEITLGFVSTGA